MGKDKSKVEFDGEEYDSYEALCDEYEVKYTTFLSRKAKGYTLIECIYGRRNRKHATKPIRYDGVTYDNATVMCNKLGVLGR